MKMILNDNAIFAAQIFPAKGPSNETQYRGMIEVARGSDGPGALKSEVFKTPAEALAWLKDCLGASGDVFELIECRP